MLWLLALTLGAATSAVAQRQMERLGRGVVILRTSSTQVYVGWRLLGNDPEDIAFNLYRSANGSSPVKVNTAPLTATSDYVDTPPNLGTTSYRYTVRPVLAGSEVTDSWANPAAPPPTLPANAPLRQYLPVAIQPTPDDTATVSYKVKFCWVGDLDGDGEYDFVIDRSNPTGEARQWLQAYRRDGTQLWQINLGPNSVNHDHIEPGAATVGIGHGDNATVYDLDGDGRAEVLLRTANGVVFPDGTTITRGANDSVQFLSVIDGLTGQERAWETIPNPRLSDGPMNGHMGIVYLDGQRPSILLAAKNRADDESFHGIVAAWDWRGGALTRRWWWENSGALHAPEGHQIRLADVDNDGKDEFVDIGYVLDDDGSQLFNLPEVVHGDRFHLTDIDPDRPGLETFIIQQNNATGLATAYFDAGTGEYIRKWYAGGVVDVGRGVVLDLDANARGCEFFSTQANIYDAKGGVLHTSRPFPPEAIWWDSDLGREFIATVGSSAEAPAISKFNPVDPANPARLYTIYNETPPGVYQAFGGRPAFWGDILGDWREELLCVANDNSELRIYTTRNPALNRIYTLMHNPQYRVQATTKGYVQSSYTDYYLGHGMTPPPPPPMVEARLTWRGGADTARWNTAGTPSWWLGTAPSGFVQGDSVRFDIGSQAGSAVDLEGTLQPGAVAVHAPRDFTFNGAAGSLAGSMRLTKAGAGTLTITGTHGFSGRTTVWDGALRLDGELQQSPVVVWGGTWGGALAAGRTGGRISGSGRFSQAVAVRYRGAVTPGAGMSAAGTLSFGAGLTAEDGAVFALDLSNDPTGAVRASDRIAVTGNLTLSGTVALLVNPLQGQLAPGTYTLLTYTGALNGSAANFVVTVPPGTPHTLHVGNGAVTLTIPTTRSPASTVWRGSGTAWDLASSQNWLRAGSPDVFVSGDTVTFDATGAAAPNVTLATILPITGLNVNSTTDYTLTGSGSLHGSGGLTKSGTGTLTITTANNYTGPTIVNGGVLAVSALADGGLPSSIGASTSTAGNLQLNGGVLRLTGVQTNTNRSVVLGLGGGTIEVSTASSALQISGALSGSGRLTKGGPGTLILASANSFTGGTTISAGTIYLAGATANVAGLGSGAITLSGGRLTMSDVQANVTAPWSLFVPAGSTGRLDADGRCTLTGPLSGGGDFTFYTSFVRTDLAGNWSAFSGRIIVVADEDGGDFRLANTAGLPNSAVHLSANVYMYSRASTNQTTLPIGELSGDVGAVVNAGVGSGAGANYPAVWQVGGRNTDATFAGSIRGTSAVTKTGTGTWTLAGVNTHTGPTTVQAGTLLVSGSLTGSNVTVQSGATLGGAGTITGNVSVNSGGRLAFTADSSGIRGLRITGNLSMAGTITITAAPGSAAFTRGTHTIATYTGALSGTPTLVWVPPAGSSQTASFDLSVPGEIRMSVSRNAAQLTWTGAASTTWDTVAANWTLDGLNEVFIPPDSAFFDDSAGATNVTLAGPLEPAAVTFANSTRNFTLASTNGGLSGATTLLKTGSGTLTLTTANSYTGGTTITGGTLLLGNDNATNSALGAGVITLAGGTLQMFDSSSTFNTATMNLRIPDGASGTVRADSRIDLNGSLTGAGALNLYIPWVRTTLFLNAAAFTGRVQVITDADGGDFRVANSAGYPQSAIRLAPRVSASWFPNSAATIPLGELSGEPLSQLRGVVNNNNIPGAHTLVWEVGALGTDATFNGAIVNGTSPSRTAIRKVGNGTWTLTGENTYTGPTTVAAGTLRVTGSLAGTAALQIEPGATFELAGGTTAITGAITNNGTIRVRGGHLPNSTGPFTNNGVLDLITGPRALPANFVNNGTVLDSSVVRPESITTIGGNVLVTIRGYRGHVYQLQRSPTLDPATWQSLGPAQSGAGDLLIFTAPLSGPAGFFRILVQP